MLDNQNDRQPTDPRGGDHTPTSYGNHTDCPNAPILDPSLGIDGLYILDGIDRAIIEAHTDPKTPILQVDIEIETSLCRSTVGKRVRRLFDRSILCRPCGLRGGTTLTVFGRLHLHDI